MTDGDDSLVNEEHNDAANPDVTSDETVVAEAPVDAGFLDKALYVLLGHPPESELPWRRAPSRSP